METKMDNEKVYAMPFAKVYPLLVAKAARKGRTQAEVDEIITWLTGYSVPLVISNLSDLDEELFGWVEQAYQFAQTK